MSRQAECVMELMRCLGVPEFSVLGTSYGGFVAFRMAHMFPATVKKVIISNSGILMTPEDNVNLASRGHVNTVVDLLLPATPDALSAVSTLVFNRPLRLPRFLLHDFWSVSFSLMLAGCPFCLQSILMINYRRSLQFYSTLMQMFVLHGYEGQ